MQSYQSIRADIFAQHNTHVYAFHNAPLSQRPDWARTQVAIMQIELRDNTNRSADDYYSLKARIREFNAAILGVSSLRYDPVGYWYNNQST